MYPCIAYIYTCCSLSRTYPLKESVVLLNAMLIASLAYQPTDDLALVGHVLVVVLDGGERVDEPVVDARYVRVEYCVADSAVRRGLAIASD